MNNKFDDSGMKNRLHNMQHEMNEIIKDMRFNEGFMPEDVQNFKSYTDTAFLWGFRILGKRFKRMKRGDHYEQ